MRKTTQWNKLSRLPASLSVCLLTCLPVWLSACLAVCLSGCLPVWLSACLAVCLSACLPVCLSACLSFCLSVCLLTCLPVWLAGWFACWLGGGRQADGDKGQQAGGQAVIG